MNNEDRKVARAAIKEGDRVRIRKWDDMVEEFGVCRSTIPCDKSFTESMRHLCGREVTFREGYAACTDWSDASGDTEWRISRDMCDPVGPMTAADLLGKVLVNWNDRHLVLAVEDDKWVTFALKKLICSETIDYLREKGWKYADTPKGEAKEIR